jgi:hypothetical protein
MTIESFMRDSNTPKRIALDSCSMSLVDNSLSSRRIKDERRSERERKYTRIFGVREVVKIGRNNENMFQKRRG